MLLWCLTAHMQVDRDLRIGGWVKTGREAGGGSFAFLEVNDGSCLTNLQVHALPECQQQPCKAPVEWHIMLCIICLLEG